MDIPRFNKLVLLVSQVKAELNLDLLSIHATAAQGDRKALNKASDKLLRASGLDNSQDDFERLLKKTQGKL